MIAGHTKFKCDGSFGLIKKLYRKTSVDCVDHVEEVANGPFTEFNLLKTKKADIFEEIRALSILVLTLPPLDYKRQEYLYQNIHPFVKDEFKDITCPRPR